MRFPGVDSKLRAGLSSRGSQWSAGKAQSLEVGGVEKPLCPLHYLLTVPLVWEAKEEKMGAGLLVGGERRALP